MGKKRRSRAADYAVYVVVRCCVRVLQAMPVCLALAIARGLGFLAHRLDKRHREVAADNLRHAFPDRDEADIDRLVRATYRHACTMAIETALLMRRMRSDNVARYVRDVDPAHQRLAWELVHSHRPTIVLSGHLGNWEVLSLAMALEGGKASVVARRMDNPYLERYVRSFRESTGIHIVDKDGAAEEAQRVLAVGGNLGVVGDQDAGPKGQFVTYFGRPASTFKSIALLALQHQATILVLGCVRSGGPLEHLLFLEDIIRPEEHAGDPRAVQAITQRYTSALERIARRYPEQYFWLHRRWKSQPPSRTIRLAAGRLAA
jgi:KDO2-lipid IV(A) lauroyltransferase